MPLMSLWSTPPPSPPREGTVTKADVTNAPITMPTTTPGEGFTTLSLKA